MRFLLKEGCGQHRIGRGLDAIDYVPGDIIESDTDLVALFENKFVRLADDADIEKVTSKEPGSKVAAG